ncbi:MAG: tetratricopeptide repeat protein [Planctomycetaceae bacterium]|nr:tetratricopeptide repeat protein [Planctomycetaceae bacterium]
MSIFAQRKISTVCCQTCPATNNANNFDKIIGIINRQYSKFAIKILLVLLIPMLFLVLSKSAVSQESWLLDPSTPSPEKAKLMGYVDNYISKNFPVILRRSLEWGDVKKNNRKQYTIRYQCEAIAEGKECLVYCWDFTFDEVGNFVTCDKVEGFPKRPKNPSIKLSANNTDNQKAQDAKKLLTQKTEPAVIPVTIKDVGDSNAAYNAATKLMSENKFEEAEASYKKAFKHNPNNFLALYGIGTAQAKLKLHDDAKKTFQQCLEMKPKDSRPMVALGFIAKAEDEEEKMIEWWKKSYDADKQCHEALKALGDHYAAKNDIKNASLYYRLFLKIKPKDTQVKDALDKLKQKPKDN